MKHYQIKYSNQNTFWVLFFFVSNFLIAQNKELFSKELYFHNNDTLKYRLLLPENFSEEKEYPLVLFLHGRGEQGNDNETQLVHGSKLFLENYSKDEFPAIIIFPQCPKDDYWANVNRNESKKGLEKYKFKRLGKPTKSMTLVLSLMEDLTKKSYVKKDQVYVGGLSMGGMGTFEIINRKPDMFAAAFPICGGGNPKSVNRYANKISLWVFHGGKDDVVIPYFSLRMVAALQKKGADVKLTYFENDNHNSWDSAFAEPELLSWLFSKTKK
ncbi:prolyl oligopeptidase family serine peptidase [Gaetbulibacter sp. M235]|uniref:carboxylesterase family protein n=1 Tax=Gaetbulibacter sp. M235 TaxID=3126510 RepID=UPI00374F099A